MPEDIYNLSIRKALLTWCFEERVEDVRGLEVYFLSQELVRFGLPNLGGASNRGDPAAPVGMTLEEVKQLLQAAWANLLLDMRDRLRRGELIVRGIPSRPVRQKELVRIPGEWASDFIIDPLNDVIEFDDARYVHIRISSAAEEAASSATPFAADGTPPAMERPSHNFAGGAASPSGATSGDRSPPTLVSELPGAAARGAANTGTIAVAVSVCSASAIEKLPSLTDRTPGSEAARPQGKGRPSFVPQIEEAARHYLDELRKRGRTTNRRPVWTVFTTAILKRLETRRAGNRHVRLPRAETIRRHLPSIYARLVGENPGK